MNLISRRAVHNGAAALAADYDAAPSDDRVEAQWEAEWRHYHLRMALRTIDTEFSHADRQAFERYALRGESAKAVADALGLSLDQVYQAKSRIARRIAEIIEQQISEEG